MRRDEPELATWKDSFRSLKASGLIKARSRSAGRKSDLISTGLTAADNFNLLSPEVVRNPYPHYATLRRSGSVHFLRDQGFWLVLDYDDVAYALKHPEIFSSRRPTVRFDPVLVETDAPAHTRVRRILSPYFSTQPVQALEDYVRDCAVRLLKKHDGTGEFDLVNNFADPLTELTSGRFLGLSEDETEDLRRCLAPYKHRLDGSMYPVMEDWFREYLKRLPASAGEKLGNRLLRGEGEGALTPEEVVALLKLLWAAGTFTTARLIATSTLLLLQHPTLRTEVGRDLSLLPALIEESLRLEVPEQIVWRTTRDEGFELSGVKIPARSEVRLCIGAANRDPKRFADPDNPSLRRTPNNHLSFGAGTHFCLGALLARMEGRVALETLFAEWPDFSAARSLYTVSYTGSFHFRALEHLFVKATSGGLAQK
jgi:cytochrome P450